MIKEWGSPIFYSGPNAVSLRRVEYESRIPRWRSSAYMRGAVLGGLPIRWVEAIARRSGDLLSRMTENGALCSAPTAGTANNGMSCKGCVAGSKSEVKTRMRASAAKRQDESSKAILKMLIAALSLLTQQLRNCWFWQDASKAIKDHIDCLQNYPRRCLWPCWLWKRLGYIISATDPNQVMSLKTAGRKEADELVSSFSIWMQLRKI